MPADRPFGCTLDSTAEVRVDAAGMLGLSMKSYYYSGGAHGITTVADLNLDLTTARALDLNDLLDHLDSKALSSLIAYSLRQQRHIAADQSLKQAGFFTNQLPVPDIVLALPEGLMFTFQSYDVAPYVMGQPQALVPYSALFGMVRQKGPLPRLHALLTDPEPGSEPPPVP